MYDGPSSTDRMTAAWDALLLTLGGPPTAARAAMTIDPADTVQRIPVTVLGGFLGAGKTTLLCRLLERSSLEIVAIVNDVASINVDAALIRSKNTETVELQNGCACCVLSGDLRDTLEEIGSRDRPPDVVVIEASGISDPLGIAQTVANNAAMVLDGIVTVVDALGWRERVSDPLTATLFERQLAAAHLIALTKTAGLPDIRSLRESVGQLAPGRPVLLPDSGDVVADVLLGAAGQGARPAPAGVRHASDGFAIETVECPDPISAPEFFELLDRLPEAVYRLKGWVCLRAASAESGASQWLDVQAAGPRWRLQEQDRTGDASQLVVIGAAGERAFHDYLAALRKLGRTPQ